jgi:NitT/TauT family transport system substrate-binding protein
MSAMSKTCDRPAFLAATAAFAAAPRFVSAQGLTKLRVSGSPDHDIIGALWAVQSGIFEKLGLDVDVRVANSGAVVTAAVIGGSLDIGKSSVLGLIVAHTKNVPIVLEAPGSLYTSDAPSAALVVAKDSPIQTARDLNGATLAVPALGDLFTIVNSAWIDKNGGDLRTVKFVEFPGPASAEAIAAGRVAAATLAQPILNDALAGGKCRVLGYSFNAIANHFLATSYFTTTAFAAQNADALARFRKGLAEATAYAEAHRAEMIPLISKYSGVDPKVIATMPQAPLGTVLDPRLIQPMIDAAVKYKAIAAPFPVRDLFDPAIR